jgi:hypothetical protein
MFEVNFDSFKNIFSVYLFTHSKSFLSFVIHGLFKSGRTRALDHIE